MPDNPYAIAVTRFFLILLGIAGSLLSARIVIHSIASGRAYGLSRYSRIVGDPYTAIGNPSQFWLLITFYAAMVVLFAAIAWRAYRG